MRLQVLVSTMDQENHSLINKMNIQSDAIFINQCNEEDVENINLNEFQIKWINSKTRGLSISRNMAIENASSDICILADDDLEYVYNYKDIILRAFELNPDSDIIAFQVEGIESDFKNYHNKARKVNYLTSMKISSVEIAFRLEKINNLHIKFNELFGAGSEYYMGEENIFLVECLKNGLKINYLPIKIADLHIGESSWFKGYNEEFFIGKGACYSAMSRFFSFPLLFQFAVRKHKLYGDKMSRFQAVKFMLKGRKEFLNKSVKNY